jgi:hypothetical protein
MRPDHPKKQTAKTRMPWGKKTTLKTISKCGANIFEGA